MNTNYAIRINLRALKGAFVSRIEGKNETKKCLIIPIEESGLFEGEKGVYINMTAFKRDADKVMYGKTHSVRLSVGQDTYEAMTQEQKKEIPFLGDMLPITKKTIDDADNKPAIALPTDNEDAPF